MEAPGNTVRISSSKVLRVQSVDVVVAVVGEQEPALFDEHLQLVALGAAEPHELVARHEEEGKRQQVLRVCRDDDLFGERRNVRVLDDAS